MAERKQRPLPHPDDLMSVTVALDFRAKFNPKAADPPPFDSVGFESTLGAADAVDFLESVVRAIRERRLYGLMVQQCAENAVGAGEWVEKTPREILAESHGEENKAEQKSSQDGDEEGER